MTLRGVTRAHRQGGPNAQTLSSDRASLAEALGDERADVVLSRILVDLDEGLSRLRLLADRPRDYDELARLAHRMAGSAALIGFLQMQRLLAALEVDARGACHMRESADRLHRQIAALAALMPTRRAGIAMAPPDEEECA